MNSLVTTRCQEGLMGTICNMVLRIRHVRTQLGWSQEKLAGAADIDRKTVLRFEDGAHDVKWHNVHAMLCALGLETCTSCVGCRDNGKMQKSHSGKRIHQRVRAKRPSPVSLANGRKREPKGD